MTLSLIQLTVTAYVFVAKPSAMTVLLYFVTLNQVA